MKYPSGIIAFALSMSTGIKKSDTSVAAILPKISATPSPPKIGSVAKRRLPSIMATAVSIIGFALVAVATAMALFFSTPSSAIKDFAKSMSNRELRAEIPIREINPMSDVAVRKEVCICSIELYLICHPMPYDHPDNREKTPYEDNTA